MGSNLDMFSLKGRRALICGASRGIGAAIARLFAEAGASVNALARNRISLLEVVESLPAADIEHRAMVVDVNDLAALRQSVIHEQGDGAPFDILVNNSGGPPSGAASEASTESFQQAFHQHLLASQVLVGLLSDGMKTRGRGRIINIISTSVKEPIPGLGVSNTVRGAVASWGKTLASELGPDGITVNNILPGYTRTERLDYIFQQRADKQATEIEKIEAQAKARVPLRRFARPEEIAAAALFLASDAGAYVNGVNLPVDGGRTLSL